MNFGLWVVVFLGFKMFQISPDQFGEISLHYSLTVTAFGAVPCNQATRHRHLIRRRHRKTLASAVPCSSAIGVEMPDSSKYYVRANHNHRSVDVFGCSRLVELSRIPRPVACAQELSGEPLNFHPLVIFVSIFKGNLQRFVKPTNIYTLLSQYEFVFKYVCWN